MNYIRKHKLTSFVILVYIIVVAFAYFLYKLFIGSSGLPVYGDRLDGIENVPITEEQIDKIVEELSKNEAIMKITRPYLNGKILKVVVTVSDGAELQPLKELDSKIYNILDADQRAFYDVEYFINKDYNCTFEAKGKMDEEGVFTSDVTVKFYEDLSKRDYDLEYGMSTADQVAYNKEQTYTIKEDGEFILFGFTKDKGKEDKCSIKIVRKAADLDVKETTINTKSVDRNFPSIGYLKAGTNAFVWTK
jgi:hypothetical protein